jgi:HEAT repeat protein
MKQLVLSVLLSFVLTATFVACHAADDDVVGQADELSDPVRRQNAISKIQTIWSQALVAADGDRSAAGVQEVLDAVVEKMSKVYVENRADTQNGIAMLALLKEMNDPRAIDAFIDALDWRPEVSEAHAERAAQALQRVAVPDARKAEVVAALGAALDKIRQARPEDNRMRIEMIRALGAIGDRSATPILTKIATTQSEEQNFLVNHLAASQLGSLADPAAVEPLIQGLYLFDPNNPAMRMNDVAASALVSIGRPSLDPLLGVLRGEDEGANAMAAAYIEAVRQRNAQAADQMSVQQVVGSEATFALGSLGFREALEPLMAETNAEDPFRQVNGSLAIVRLNHAEGDRAQVRTALRRVYTGLPDDAQGVAFKAQMIAAIRSLYDPGFLEFFLGEVQNDENHPQVRIEAMNAYALLANKNEMVALTRWITGATEDAYHGRFQQESEKPVAVANECDEAIPCYIGKLADGDVAVVRKAAFMLGRLGRGNEEVVTALVDKLNHMDVQVRLTAVAALDRVATAGSQAAIDKISELEEMEAGRAVWVQFSREALPTQARLRARMSQ